MCAVQHNMQRVHIVHTFQIKIRERERERERESVNKIKECLEQSCASIDKCTRKMVRPCTVCPIATRPSTLLVTFLVLLGSTSAVLKCYPRYHRPPRDIVSQVPIIDDLHHQTSVPSP